MLFFALQIAKYCTFDDTLHLEASGKMSNLIRTCFTFSGQTLRKKSLSLRKKDRWLSATCMGGFINLKFYHMHVSLTKIKMYAYMNIYLYTDREIQRCTYSIAILIPELIFPLMITRISCGPRTNIRGINYTLINKDYFPFSFLL